MNNIKLMNYTSVVPAEKSILEIERLLSKAGASKIAKDYLRDGTVKAFIFSIPLEHGPVLFRLPCDVDSVFAVLMNEYKRPRQDTAKKVRRQAERVAWRIMLDWIEAQITMIQLHQVKPEQVFLPYAYDSRTGKTLFQRIEEKGFLMLDSGDS